MPGRDFSNPGTKFVEVSDRPERSTGVPSGITASWTAPIDAIDPALVSADQRKMLLETQQKQALEKPAEIPQPPTPNNSRVISLPSQRSQGSDLVLIPAQAMEQFRALLGTHFPDIKVSLTAEEAGLLLVKLEEMETPKKMSDAKAIIKLSDSLERLINEAEDL